MSRLLAASSGAIIGSSQDLTTRIVRLKADAPWTDQTNPYSPGEWKQITLSASPASSSPGNTVTLDWTLPKGTPRKIEELFVDFNVVNGHATDNLRCHNLLAFASGLKLHLNGTLKEYNSNLELRLLLAGHLLTRPSTDAIYHDLAVWRAATGAYDQGTLTGLNFPGSSTTQVSIPVFQLWPWLSNSLVGSGPLRSIKLELSFRPGFGTAGADSIDFINSTNAASLYATSISFTAIKLRAEMSAIQTPALLIQPSNVRYPISYFHTKSYTLDLSSTGASQTIRLASDMPRTNPIIRTWAILRDTGACTGYSDADGGNQLQSGPEYLGFTLNKVGSTDSITATTRAASTRWHLQQYRMAQGRAMPPCFYDGSSNLDSTWVMLPLIDWRAMYTDNSEIYSDSQMTVLYGGLNTKAEDWELTVYNTATMSSACQLWIVNETCELGLFGPDGQFGRIQL